ncbi:MAG: hypothetical protein ACI8W7_004352, partial [Gammaproteobacteria bacterium]
MKSAFKNSFTGLGAILAATLFSSIPPAAQAATCDPGKPGAKLSGAEAATVYECIKQSLYDGYQKGSKG